ncbi:gas vesicle protein GvpM [Haloarcula salina]|uniref:Gas vesicle protein n=1 Tax=Haloarcula salina TaxID=1429914 RepID=A0AA41G0F9_9EURY|nr:gas vesicle protein GvpJ [Haloarcula salina]MBV0901935.1 gas vesicle protein [Haloarcula salina]
MEPTREGDAVVDLLDVLLRDGVVLQADVVVTVADVPLIGISLRAAIAGMATMRDYGYFEDWDDDARAAIDGSEAADGRRDRTGSGRPGDGESGL